MVPGNLFAPVKNLTNQIVEFFVDLCYSIKETYEGFIGSDDEKVDGYRSIRQYNLLD